MTLLSPMSLVHVRTRRSKFLSLSLSLSFYENEYPPNPTSDIDDKGGVPFRRPTDSQTTEPAQLGSAQCNLR
jgi:hypothetical protein